MDEEDIITIVQVELEKKVVKKKYRNNPERFLYETKLLEFQKAVSKFICKQSQSMGLHTYYDVKKQVIKAINDLEMIW